MFNARLTTVICLEKKEFMYFRLTFKLSITVNLYIKKILVNSLYYYR